MGITEDIRRTIQTKLVIRYKAQEQAAEAVPCVLCGKSFKTPGPLCLYVRGDGHMCEQCGERFAPEMMQAMREYKDKDVRKLLSRITDGQALLNNEEWQDVHEHLNSLLKITTDLAKGISRGIVEAPSGHIGLLYLAKDIPKPARKDSETDKDYELRVKSYRTARIYEKIRKETWGRVKLLQDYFVRLGLPQELFEHDEGSTES